jgi:hypothetical protein
MKLYSTKTLGSQGVLIGKTLLVKDWIKDKLLNSNYYCNCMEFFELTQVACRTYYNLCPLRARTHQDSLFGRKKTRLL